MHHPVFLSLPVFFLLLSRWFTYSLSNGSLCIPAYNLLELKNASVLIVKTCVCGFLLYYAFSFWIFNVKEFCEILTGKGWKFCIFTWISLCIFVLLYLNTVHYHLVSSFLFSFYFSYFNYVVSSLLHYWVIHMVVIIKERLFYIVFSNLVSSGQ